MALDITQVKVVPTRGDKLKGFASIVLNDVFLVGDIKIIEGSRGLFLSMPSKKRKDGSYRDIAHPLNQETRELMEQVILDKYQEIMDTEEDDDFRDEEPEASSEEPEADTGSGEEEAKPEGGDIHDYLDSPVGASETEGEAEAL